MANNAERPCPIRSHSADEQLPTCTVCGQRTLIFLCLQVWHALDRPGTPTIFFLGEIMISTLSALDLTRDQGRLSNRVRLSQAFEI
jgi:hypothetical protein